MEFGKIPDDVREIILNRIEQNEDRAVRNLEEKMFNLDRRVGLLPPEDIPNVPPIFLAQLQRNQRRYDILNRVKDTRMETLNWIRAYKQKEGMSE